MRGGSEYVASSNFAGLCKQNELNLDVVAGQESWERDSLIGLAASQQSEECL